jgi:hypothetical protein
MSSKRFLARVPSATKLCVATLGQHQLRFHKRGMDDSAKCDVLYTGNADDHVIGVIFEILATDKYVLDSNEGPGYEEKQVSVTAIDSKLIDAFTYVATHIDKSMRPYQWYKEHVLMGAREHRLPDDYISSIETIGTIEDTDVARIERELSVYRR